MHESAEAAESLAKAIRLSHNQNWLANTRLMMAVKAPSHQASVFSLSKTRILEEVDGDPTRPPLDSGTDANPVTLFRCASAVLCRALLQEARRARIGCPFGLPPGPRPAASVTTARNPSKIAFKGNPFQDQVPDVEIRTARVLTERNTPGINGPITSKIKIE